MSNFYKRFIGITLISVLALAGAVSAQDEGPANLQFEDSELSGMSWDDCRSCRWWRSELFHVGW